MNILQFPYAIQYDKFQRHIIIHMVFFQSKERQHDICTNATEDGGLGQVMLCWDCYSNDDSLSCLYDLNNGIINVEIFIGVDIWIFIILITDGIQVMTVIILQTLTTWLICLFPF